MPLFSPFTGGAGGIPTPFSINARHRYGGVGSFPGIPGSTLAVKASDIGRKIYILTREGLHQVENPDLAIESAFYDGVSIAHASFREKGGFDFSRDGTRLLIANDSSGSIAIVQYNLGVPWDIGTAAGVSSLPIYPDTWFGGVAYGNYDATGAAQSVYQAMDEPPFQQVILKQFDMADPSLVSTGSEVATTNLSYPTNIENIMFSIDGDTLFLNDLQATLNIEHMDTPWDINSLRNSVSINMQMESGAPSFPAPSMFSYEGNRLYSGNTNSMANYYTAFMRPEG